MIGENKTPKKQRTRVECYSRVVGFLTPISQWNKGKKEEFRDRKTFDKQLRPAPPAAITPEEGR